MLYFRYLCHDVDKKKPLKNSPKSPKFPPRHLGDFSWAPSSSKPHKPWSPNTSTASHYWSWIRWLIGNRSNNTWIVKEPVTLRDHRGRPAYPLLSMFKAVLLGQWHSLSDPRWDYGPGRESCSDLRFQRQRTLWLFRVARMRELQYLNVKIKF